MTMNRFEELKVDEEFYFQWHITEKCNLRCKHCYHENYSSANELSLDNLIDVADKINSALIKWDKKGTLSVTGGEPFVVGEKLFPLITHLDSLPAVHHFDILTNGWFIDQEVLDRLKGISKLRRVQVSLEASRPDLNDFIRSEGSFEKTLDAIRLMKKNGFHVAVMTTISMLNKDEILSLIHLLQEEGVDTFAAERFIPEGKGLDLSEALLSPADLKKVFSEIYDLAFNQRDIRILLYRPLFALLNGHDPTVGAMCSAATNALTIMHDGTLYPCRRLPIPLGNVLNESLYKVWYTSDVLWNIRNINNLKGKCAQCDLVPLCRGCRAMAYAVTGDYFAEDPQCWK
jgi:radical SAM protein with 4Fe4S-binding SPASM domain